MSAVDRPSRRLVLVLVLGWVGRQAFNTSGNGVRPTSFSSAIWRLGWAGLGNRWGYERTSEALDRLPVEARRATVVVRALSPRAHVKLPTARVPGNESINQCIPSISDSCKP